MTVIKSVAFNNSVLVTGANGEPEVIEQEYSCTLRRVETSQSETGLLWVVTQVSPCNTVVNEWESYAVAVLDMRSFTKHIILENLE